MARCVMVTGASRGLGLEFVRQCRTRGDQVLATVRSAASGKAAADLGARLFSLDVAEPASIAALSRDLAGQPIDVLINNAGVIGQDKAVGGLSMEEFRRVFETNTFAPALVAQALLPNLRAGQRRAILNISSELGSIDHATPGFSYAYNASKAALNMLTARLAKDLAQEKFTVISFCPGWNRTDMGGSEAPLDPRDSIRQLLATFDRLSPADSGKYMRIDGTEIPY